MKFKFRLVLPLVTALVATVFIGSPAQAAPYDAYPSCSPLQSGMTLKISPTMTGGNLNVQVCRMVSEKVTYTTGTKNGKKVTVQNVARVFKVVPETQTFVITAGQAFKTATTPARMILNYSGMARISSLSYSLVVEKSDPTCSSYTTNSGLFVAYAGETPSATTKCVYVGVATLSATGQKMTTPELTVTPLPGRIVP